MPSPKQKKHTPVELYIHCDEAGRGPLAGPITVGCCLMIATTDLSSYKDSKQLSKKQRETLYTQIKTVASRQLPVALLTATGRASAEEIDTVGIIQATQLACRRGIGKLLIEHYHNILTNRLVTSATDQDRIAKKRYDQLCSQQLDEHTIIDYLQISNSFCKLAGLVRDGNHTFGLDTVLDIPVVTIIKGDQKNPLISIASICAKVERDAYMTDIAPQYPLYQFDRHKGYGTLYHRTIIHTHGLTPLHRKSFCQQALSGGDTPSSSKPTKKSVKKKVSSKPTKKSVLRH